MPGRLLLPKNTLGTPDYDIGKWKNFSDDFAELQNKIEKPENINTSITSIPSPWARMILFRDALSTEHKLHDTLTSELLDVLEIIFFKRSIIYDLSFEEINFTHEKSNFIEVIKDLNPESKSFSSIRLYYLREPGFDTPMLLAGSSPYTLFFTPETKSEKFKRYFHNQRKFNERPEYFQKYIKKIASIINQKVKNGNRLLKSLNDFLSDIVKTQPNTLVNLNGENKDILDNCSVFTTENETDIFTYSLDHVESALKIKGDKLNTTPPLVLKNEYRGVYYNNYLFPEEIRDLTAFRDRDILPNEMIKYPWIFPEIDFLEDHIIKVPYEINDDVLILGEKGKSQNKITNRYLIPLKAKFFEYFNINSIDDLLRIDEVPGGRVEVRLKIPVVGKSELDTIQVSKSYYGPNQIIEAKFDDVPYLAIWPKIPPAYWNEKYFMLEFNKEKSNMLSFIDPNGKLIEVFSPDDKARISNSTSPFIIKQEKGEETYIYCFDEPPEVIQMKVTKNNKIYNGLFLLDKNNLSKIEIGENKSAVISVDFGTSNTTIAYTITGISEKTSIFENKNSTQVPFNYSEFVFLFSYPQEINTNIKVFLNALNYSFFPQYFSYDANINKNEAIVPFSSIINYQSTVQTNQVIIKANIPFYLTWASDKFNLLGDLKWQTSDQARGLTQLYVEQLHLMIKSFLIKNGVANKNVTLIWSYPRSFSKTQKTHLEVTWNNFLKNGGYKVNQIDESRASLFYFIGENDLKAYKDTLKVTMDIGGGTSDISAHHANQNIMFSSTLIGGNDLIGESDIESPIYKFLVNKAEEDKGGNLFTTINFMQNAEFERIESTKIKFNYIVKKELKNDKLNMLVSGLDFNFGRFVLLYFFSILFYEVGLKLKAINHKDYPENFFCGGNGSNFLKWLNFGDWTTENESITFFNQILKAALEIKTNKEFKILISPKPKSEVAIGACYSVVNTTLLQNNSTQDTQILGENILLNDKIYPWDSGLNKLGLESIEEMDFTRMDFADKSKSTLINFNKVFFENSQKSNLIDFKNDSIMRSSINELKEELLDVEILKQFLRKYSQDLYTRTQDIKVSLFVLGAKGCLNRIMKIIRNKM